MKKVRFQNHDCFLLENNFLQMIISSSVGPRILSLNLHGKQNILAELPDFTATLPDGSTYHFLGGHRLWVAPEIMPLTYDHDDKPVEVKFRDDGVLITKKVEEVSKIEKSIQIKLDPEKPLISIKHHLKNTGKQSIECAPWAITQLKTGGVAILPQNGPDTGFLPNRSLVIWPYTDVKDPCFKWENDYIFLEAEIDSPFKIGFPNPRGWLAYWFDGSLFVKHAPYDPEANYYDLGSSSECYCNDQFLELETLGPITTLASGETISHLETWELFADVERPETEADLASLVTKLGLK
jgi:hypothetical protein